MQQHSPQTARLSQQLCDDSSIIAPDGDTIIEGTGDPAHCNYKLSCYGTLDWQQRDAYENAVVAQNAILRNSIRTILDAWQLMADQVNQINGVTQ